MRKWMAMVLAVMVAVGMAGCNSGGGMDEDGTPTPPPQAEVADGEVDDQTAPGEDAPQPVERDPIPGGTPLEGATITINGVTYGKGDQVRKLVENGWRARDSEFKEHPDMEIRVPEGKNLFMYSFIHDDLDARIDLTFTTVDQGEDATYAEASIKQIDLVVSGGTPWDIGGIVDYTDTLDSVQQFLPDVFLNEEGEGMAVYLNDYYNYEANGSMAELNWSEQKGCFWLVKVKY